MTREADTTVFLDANVPLYLLGRDRELKGRVHRAVAHAVEEGHVFVTNAEVLREILHRYIGRRSLDRGENVFVGCDQAFRDVQALCRDIWPVTADHVLQAAEWAKRYPGVPSRDVLHLATMKAYQVRAILTADRHFDVFEGVHRIDPIAPQDAAHHIRERGAGYRRRAHRTHPGL